MWERLKEIYAYREMLKNLVSKELRARYKGSILGFFWTFFNPLLMLIVYSFVFSFIMRSAIEKYTMFLFVALLPWNYLSGSIIQGAASLVANASLIKKVYFPRELLPLSVVLSNLVNYLLSLLILIPALLLFKIRLTWALLAFPLVLLVETILVASLTLLVSVGNVYFRDLEHITGVFMTVWFFLTPVVYSTEMAPPNAKKFFALNPAAHIVEAYRDIFYKGIWPDWNALLYVGLSCLILFCISLLAFQRWQQAVAEEI
ncbi:ABC transporter permease [Thermosediminibacter oceani]|uniref:Transport permease protein n=1 Tax=Thermosediminibacter oceani (strain ATCC BAA-1034 / DSM 16646 / JW/IW-1228P) TaxID=555079 RepID=D9S1I7_THEOJ|nr:ABC transporter permease [Thermosediminibacter oceani]ADL07264.1 ABC-2 type transporter [Thermosediminibacter oceani DSM 16646]